MWRGFSTSALGRKRTVKSGHLSASECPVWVKAVIQLGRMAALRPKAVIELELTPVTAIDP